MTEITKYQVLVTPLEWIDTYGTVIDITKDVDISDFVRQNGIGNIKREIDNGDFDVGVFTFGNINLKCLNYTGLFNDSRDARSLFTFKRDLAKVDIKFFDEDGVETFRFKGLINDDATKQDFTKAEVKFRVLSLQSIIRQTKVTGGQIGNGFLFSTAIKTILNIPEITNVLNFDANNINVDFDGIIDDGEVFSDTPTKNALDQLLLASNSVFLVDVNDNIIVKPRTENAVTFELFGPGDTQGRENIIKINNLNTGFQRAFSSIKVNDTEVSNAGAIVDYGVRQKSISFGFITNATTEQDIGNTLLTEFATFRDELTLTVLSRAVSGIQLLDAVSISYPLRIQPREGKKIPMSGGLNSNDTDFQVPFTIGDLEIFAKLKWKVIAIAENPADSTTQLKLRLVGTVRGEETFFFDRIISDGRYRKTTTGEFRTTAEDPVG